MERLTQRRDNTGDGMTQPDDDPKHKPRSRPVSWLRHTLPAFLSGVLALAAALHAWPTLLHTAAPTAFPPSQ